MNTQKMTTTSEAYLQRLFTMFAKTEINPRAYIESLVPHNLEYARRVATRRGRGWRKELRESITAVKAAKTILKSMPVMVAVMMLTACNAVDFVTGVRATPKPCNAITTVRTDTTWFVRASGDSSVAMIAYYCGQW